MSVASKGFYMFPVYNQFDNTWIVQDDDGSLKTISNEEYERDWKSKKFRTRYDKD